MVRSSRSSGRRRVGSWLLALPALGLAAAALLLAQGSPVEAIASPRTSVRIPPAPVAATQVPESGVSRELQVHRGSTLASLLNQAGAAPDTAHEMIGALRHVFDPRELRPGQVLEVAFRDAKGSSRLSELRFTPSLEREIRVRRGAQGSFEAEETLRPLETRLAGIRGSIESSLFRAGRGAGATAAALTEMIHAFSFSVDFQRDIRRGDRFELLYEELYDEQGRLARTGRLLFASLTLSGRRIEHWRHELADGRHDNFDASGASVRKTLMRTPIDGARLSSGYGRRRHPVLGYSKMHRGVDFAAPIGTPIYAAGDGVIERIGPFSTFGNYIRIRHNASYQTAYAHMRGFASNLRRGSRVHQGQVIGYLGRTGRVSGPHLHYEVHLSGRQVNPRTVQLPSGETLLGEELERFQAARRRINRLRGRTMFSRWVSRTPPPAEPSSAG